MANVGAAKQQRKTSCVRGSRLLAKMVVLKVARKENCVLAKRMQTMFML